MSEDWHSDVDWAKLLATGESKHGDLLNQRKSS